MASGGTSSRLDLQFERDLNALFELLGPSGSSTDSGSKAKAMELQEEDDPAKGYHSGVVDPTDTLHESVDASLNRSSEQKHVALPLPSESKTTASLPKLNKRPFNTQGLPKPQLQFKKTPDNSHGPWKHSLSRKFHALKPLDPCDTHPYRFEITHVQYPATLLDLSVPQQPESLESTPFEWVHTSLGLTELLAKLKAAREIAIDLKHNYYRTYAGFVCLMQISTRNEDFIVDTLALREELDVLNDVFTDPSIVKVIHAARMDVIWLQQDFNLYIVNLFDTFQANRELNRSKKPLAYLLDKYCSVTADIRYQSADWRIRPLPLEMIYYARSNTHFLLFIYDSLRRDLLAQSQGTDEAIRRVLRDSETTALNVFHTDMRGERESKETLMKKCNQTLNGKSRFVFNAIYAWRDRVAREEDENTGYVLPNHQLVAIVDRPLASVVQVLKPTPPLVEVRAIELSNIIKNGLNTYMQSEIRRWTAERTEAIDSGMGINSGLISVVTDIASAEAETPTAAASGHLFSPLAGALPFVATNSSLFGKVPTIPNVLPKSTRYLEIADRVHRLQVIIPAISKTVAQKQLRAASSDDMQQSSTIKPILAQQQQCDVALGSSTLLLAVKEEEEPLMASGSSFNNNNCDILLLPGVNKRRSRKRKD
ncbi:exosome nuclease subunit [Tulasnella sp. JGI-2019a]|nr:exosome nuclease subunit [Tulasnella sp. JGI-2019a]